MILLQEAKGAIALSVLVCISSGLLNVVTTPTYHVSRLHCGAVLEQINVSLSVETGEDMIQELTYCSPE